MGEAKWKREHTQANADAGFKDYSARYRKFISKVSDMEIGEGWMRGELAKAIGIDMLVLHPRGEPVRRSNCELKLELRYYHLHVFTAVLPDIGRIDAIVRDWVEMMKLLPPSKDRRNSTRDFLMEWLLENRHYTDEPHTQNHSGAIMATAMLWLHMTGPLERFIRAALNKAKDAGHSTALVFEVTDMPGLIGHKAYNWRTILNASDDGTEIHGSTINLTS
ncbi:hypothetical protein [Bradyrhizobium sp. th.b2]|uniref:hypothetical protein n=1 Tax=Bradyrhizobium sp. th-b2 TaxID=172088 RepID=UPI0003F87DD3|nr:hypothetical protein [Bradyrhizobium sp. th.b2]